MANMEGNHLERSLFTAQQIAEWFLAWAEHVDADDISNLKLQKLLYYAQGHYLGRNSAPLFADQIEAWAHGPVVPDVYHEFKEFGKAPIDTFEVILRDFDWDQYPEDVANYLMEVWETYGHLAAWTLREKTHRESPWRDAFERRRNQVIEPEAMQAFFATAA